MTEKPKLHGKIQSELDKAEKSFDEFDKSVKDMTLDRMNAAPKQETEHKISDSEIRKSTDIYLKPIKKAGPAQKFNEKFRPDYEYAREYVQFIAYNNEINGEEIDIWTRPFGGMEAEEWKVPCNKPVWGPRYLAEQIKRKYYHRLIMQENVSVGTNAAGVMTGRMVVDSTVSRLDAAPVNSGKSVFRGVSNF